MQGKCLTPVLFHRPSVCIVFHIDLFEFLEYMPRSKLTRSPNFLFLIFEKVSLQFSIEIIFKKIEKED